MHDAKQDQADQKRQEIVLLGLAEPPPQTLHPKRTLEQMLSDETPGNPPRGPDKLQRELDEIGKAETNTRSVKRPRRSGHGGPSGSSASSQSAQAGNSTAKS